MRLVALFIFFIFSVSCSKKECYQCQKNEVTVSTYCETDMTAFEFESAEETCSKISGEWIKVDN